MAQLTVGDKTVTIDDAFLKLSPEQQNAAVHEIASSIGAKASAPAAPVGLNDAGRSIASGFDLGSGVLNKLDAATNAALAPALNRFFDEKDQLPEATFSERYAHSLRDQEGSDEKFAAGHPIVDTAGKMVGGAATGLGLASRGVTAARFLAPEAGLVARTAASAADAAGLGGVSGAMEGNSVGDHAQNALKGAGAGLVVGTAAPLGFAALKSGIVDPVVSNIAARVNPQRFAEGQVARAVQESGLTPNQISLDAIQAANEGQGVYTLADAMGTPGQRMLSTVARAPGDGRTAVVDALQSRQGDQGRRLAGTFREGFDAPQTADATKSTMEANASFEAGRNYAPVKRETSPIDVSAPVAIANRAISPAADNLATAQGALPTDLAARSDIERSESALRDPIGNALKEARSYLAAPNLTSSNVNKAFRAKTNIDMMISKATDNKQGALVGELMPIRDALDNALAQTSSNYAAARDSYRVAQQRINALDLGKELGSKPGRPEDAIRQFQALGTPEERQAFRVGYADPYVRDAQNAAFGTDKSRPLTSDAVKQEFDAFAAPGRADLLNRQIGREKTMFETRNAALGGSKTADNLADAAAMSVSPEVVGMVGHILHGNIGGAVKVALHAGANAFSGSTPAVRKAVSDILLQRGGNMNPDALEKMVTQVVGRMQRAQEIARTIGQASRSGAAVAAGENMGAPN